MKKKRMAKEEEKGKTTSKGRFVVYTILQELPI